MPLILWSSSGLSAVAGAFELSNGDTAMGVGLFALALVIGPVLAWVTR